MVRLFGTVEAGFKKFSIKHFIGNIIISVRNLPENIAYWVDPVADTGAAVQSNEGREKKPQIHQNQEITDYDILRIAHYTALLIPSNFIVILHLWNVKEFIMLFLDRITDLINERGTNRNKFLMDLGLNKSAIYAWEQRGTVPSGDVIARIAKYFGVSADYLLGLTDQKEEKPTPEGERKSTKEDLMAAFWGGDKDLSPEDMDAMWQDVENFAAFVAQKKKEEKRQ